MKKIFSKILVMLMICVLAGGFLPAQSTEAASVKLSETQKTLYTGENFILVLKNAKKTVKWKSSNEKVAKIDSNGKVTAVASGTANITAKYKTATYTCKVTVKTPHINCKSAELYVDGTLQLDMFGTNAVKYTSTNEEIAQVSNTGLVKAVGAGSTEVNVLCSDGKSYKCKIKVETIIEGMIPVTELDYFAKDSYLTLIADKLSDVKDNMGNIHENVCSFGLSSYNDYERRDISYKVSGEYSYISGVFYQIYDHRSSDRGCTLYIYGDDTELWEGYMVGGKDPISFNVSIKNVSTLKIRIQYSSYLAPAECAIGEFCLIP